MEADGGIVIDTNEPRGRITPEQFHERQPIPVPIEAIEPTGEPDRSMEVWIIDYGLMSPPAVRRQPDGRYTVIAGRRRLAAIRYLVAQGHWCWSERHQAQRPAVEVFGQGVPCLVLAEGEEIELP